MFYHVLSNTCSRWWNHLKHILLNWNLTLDEVWWGMMGYFIEGRPQISTNGWVDQIAFLNIVGLLKPEIFGQGDCRFWGCVLRFRLSSTLARTTKDHDSIGRIRLTSIFSVNFRGGCQWFCLSDLWAMDKEQFPVWISFANHLLGSWLL